MKTELITIFALSLILIPQIATAQGEDCVGGDPNFGPELTQIGEDIAELGDDLPATEEALVGIFERVAQLDPPPVMREATSHLITAVHFFTIAVVSANDGDVAAAESYLELADEHLAAFDQAATDALAECGVSPSNSDANVL